MLPILFYEDRIILMPMSDKSTSWINFPPEQCCRILSAVGNKSLPGKGARTAQQAEPNNVRDNINRIKETYVSMSEGESI